MVRRQELIDLHNEIRVYKSALAYYADSERWDGPVPDPNQARRVLGERLLMPDENPWHAARAAAKRSRDVDRDEGAGSDVE